MDPTSTAITTTKVINDVIINNLPDVTIPIVTGCIAFGSTLALSTLTQKFIGISTGTIPKFIPSMFGMVTVCVASLASHHLSIVAYECQWQNQLLQQYNNLMINMNSDNNNNNKNRRRNKNYNTNNSNNKSIVETLSSSMSFVRREYYNIGGLQIPLHDVRVCLIGLITFKLLGGRFWSISPSSYTNIGSFARWSIPCTEKYATQQQRTMIEKMGKKWGCHTCGSHMLFQPFKKFKFVGDHMPPKSVANQQNETFLRKYILGKVKYRFYPQCINCSQIQGSTLSKKSLELGNTLPKFIKASKLQNSGGGQLAKFHGLRFRINHLTGGILAGITTIGTTTTTTTNNDKLKQQQQNHIKTGNQQRFESIQQNIVGWIYNNIPSTR